MVHFAVHHIHIRILHDATKIETHMNKIYIYILALFAMFPKERNTTKNKWLEQGEQSCIIPFEHHVRNVVFWSWRQQHLLSTQVSLAQK